MPIISLRCKNCGSMMSIDMDSKTVHCSHCASTFLLSELLDKKDIDVISKLKPNELTEKMEASAEIKQGDSRLYAGDFKTAEKHYKRAIALDENNFRGYLGVVRAKTKNFNILPANDDYAEYAKLATKHVDKENSSYLKNELVKLELLKNEKRRQKEIAAKKQLEGFNKIQRRKRITNVLLCIILMCVIIGASITIPILLKKSPVSPATKAKTITITSASDLLNFKQTKENLSANIVLENNIDFENQTLSPIGSKNEPFVGSFDGRGFTLTNVKIKDPNTPNENAVGLFGYAQNATIKNLKLDGVYVSENRNTSIFNHNNVGLICGVANSVTFENIEILSTSEIHLSLESIGTYSIGGIVGTATNVNITNSYSNAELSTNLSNIALGFGTTNPLGYHLGSLVGLATKLSISNCYSVSKVTSSIVCIAETYSESHIGGLVGLANDSDSKISKSYFAGQIASSKTSQNSNNYALLGNFKTSIELENCFAFLSDNILENSTVILSNKLCDYELAELEVVSTETDLLELVSIHFNENIWNNQSITPTLK